MSLDLDAIRQRAEAMRWSHIGRWVVVEVGHHTCGTERGGHYGHHEPGCGTEPVAEALSEDDARCIADAHNVSVAEVERLRATVERVEALADEAEAHTAASPSVFTGAPWTSIARLRAALAGPAEQGGE